jgi:hypothetical protein
MTLEARLVQKLAAFTSKLTRALAQLVEFPALQPVVVRCTARVRSRSAR